MEQLFEFIGNHPFLVGAFLLTFALFVRNEVVRGGRVVTPQELVNLVNRDGAVVIDVRDAKEFAQGHIVDAVNVPHAALGTRVGELDKYKSKPVVVACKMGQHAGPAGTVLRKAGFENVARLKGGVTGWLNDNLPVVKG
ncbi:MAG: rhodanese-like domain-containing protein [Gammaproteobacteria bacterium]|nr:rhodanese-like domain-containing protein [Gammaproteobacteria bacterium]